MRTHRLALRKFLLCAACLTSAVLPAATVTWDTSTTAGFQSGNGTWGTNAFWSADGTTLLPWVAGDVAVFQGESVAVTNAITVGSVQNISGISFGSTTTSGNWIISGSTLNLSAAATFTVNASSTSSIGNVISGGFGLTKAGEGVLTLGGLNTYTGATAVSAGTLTLATGASMSSASLSVAAGANLILNSNATTSALTGSGNVTIGNGATLTLNTTSGNPQFHGVFAGSGSLVKSGAGEVYLTGDNSGFTGAVTVNGGMISTQNAVSSLGSGDVTVTANATIGTFAAMPVGRLNNKLNVVAGTLTLGRTGRTILGNDVIASGSGSIVIGGGGVAVIEKDIRNTGTGTLSVASGSTLQLGNGGTTGTFNGGLAFSQSAGNLVFNRSDNVTYSGALTGTGSLNQLGSGNLTLTGLNTYTGATAVSAGTLTLATGASMGSAALSVVAGANLTLNSNATTSALTGSGAVTIGTGATLTLNTTSGNPQFLGVFVGSGNLVKSGAGEVFLTGDNSGFTGAVTVNGGMISTQNQVSSLGSGDVTVTANATIGTVIPTAVGRLNNKLDVTAGTLTLGRNGRTILGNDVIASGSGSIVIGGGGVAVIEKDIRNIGTGTLSVAATTTLQIGSGGTTGTLSSNLSCAGILAFDRSDSVTYTGLLAGAGGLNQLGSGNLILTGANTYTGTTTVSRGTLTLASGASMGAGALSVASGASLILNSSATTSALTGLGTVRVGDGTTLTLNTTSAAPQFLGVFAGSGNLVKSGAGEVYLTGDNSGFSGAVTVNGGMISTQNAVSSLGSGDVTVTASATIGTHATMSVGRLNNKLNVIAGTLTLGRNGRTILGNDVIASGSGSIVVGGGGVAVIEKDISNIGTGALSVAAGSTLQLGNGGTTGTLSGSLSYAGSLAFNRSDSVTYAGVLSGTGSLNQLGSGNLVLTGTNTYTGTTTVSAGTLTLATGASMSSGSLSVAAGANLVLNSNATTSALTGSGAVTIGNGTTLTLNATSGNPQFLGVFAGSGNLVKSGAGEVFLAGDNSGFTGTVTVNGGMISTQNVVSSLGSGDIIVTASATVGTHATTAVGRLNNKLNVTSGTLTLGRTGRTILGNDVIASGTGSIVIGGGGVAVIEKDIGNIGTGTLSVAAGSTLQLGNGGTTGTFNGGLAFNQSTGNLAFNRSDNSTYSGTFTGTGSLTQAGAGNLTLTGANSYTGATTVSAGTLTLATGASMGSGAVSVATGANLALNSNATTSALTGSGAVTIGSGATLTLNATTGWPQFQGVFAGSGNLVKSGAGEVFLTGDNSGFTGTVTVNGGMITTQNVVSSLGSGSITVTASATIGSNGTTTVGRLNNKLNVTAGTLTLGRTGRTILGDDVIASGSGSILIGGGGVAVIEKDIRNIGTGTLSVATGTTLQLGGGGTTGTFNGGLAFNQSTGNLAFNRSDNVTYSGVLSGTGSLTQAGVGNLTLTGANTYAGTTTVSAGTLTVGTGGSLGAGGVILSGGSIVGGTLSVTGLTATAGNYSGVLTGTAGFTKTGVGTLALGGANTFTGLTTVAGGTLLVHGSVGAVSVSSAATLGGRGSVGATALASGGNLAPGASVGTLTLASLTASGGASLTFEFNDATAAAGVGYDTAIITGNLDLSGASSANKINLRLISLANPLDSLAGTPTAFAVGANYQFTLFRYGSLNLGGNTTISDLFTINTDDFSDQTGAAVASSNFSIANDASNQSLVLSYTSPIPEPSTYGLSLGCLGLAIAAVRRRRRMTV